ncbi:MAG: hypothetical protein U9Q03_05530 [Patescibacteria group bacterium]|nr:hypothetical protein [Patescibacteria group bacterium]
MELKQPAITPFPGFMDCLKRTLKRYAERPFVFVVIGLTASLIPAVILFLGLFPAILGTRPGQLDFISSPMIQLSTTLLMTILAAPFYTALGYAASRPATLPTALRRGFSLALTWLLAYTLTGLALLLPSLLLFPGAVMGVHLSLLMPVVVNEKLTGFIAMRRSADLIRGRFLKILLSLIIFVFLASVISLSMSLAPQSVLSSLAGLVVSSAIIAPLLFIFLQILYEDLKAEKKDIPTAPRGYRYHKILAGIGLILIVLLSTAINRTL